MTCSAYSHSISIEGGSEKDMKYRSCFRFHRGAIYKAALEEETYADQWDGRRREVAISDVKATKLYVSLR